LIFYAETISIKNGFMKKLFFGLAVSLLPLIFASCREDNSTADGTWQSGQTSAVLNAVSANVYQVNQSKAPLLQTLQFHSTTQVAMTLNCTGGGTTTIAGTLGGTTTGVSPDDGFNFNYIYTLSFDQCLSPGDDGNSYSISSTGITVTGSSTWQNSGTVQNITATGSDNFTIDGYIEVASSESLNCDISLSQSTTSSESSGVFSQSGSYTGEFCGQPENGTIAVNGSLSSS
jgi:hypothetical protein